MFWWLLSQSFSCTHAEFVGLNACVEVVSVLGLLHNREGAANASHESLLCQLEDQASHTVQGASGLTLAARLNQQALLPDMMFPTVNRFNPDNGQPLPTSNGETPLFSG